MLEMQALLAHPDAPPTKIKKVEARSRRSGPSWYAEFLVTHSMDLRLPKAILPPDRTDGLWQQLCFEMFIRPDDGNGYLEFNFSPTRQWAAYAFDDYRSGMRALPLDTSPLIKGVLGAKVDLPDLMSRTCRVGLSAIIVEADGTKSYWALAHPPEGPPDFHHPDGFALTLPPTH